MQLQLPKPLRGWRKFVGEVGIIVVGVLIALGAQSLVEQRHWREEVKTSNAAFQEELGTAALVAYERLIIQPCLQERIRDLSRLLSQNEGPWTALPMAVHNTQYANVMPIAYRAPSRLLPSDGWKNAIANGALSHFPGQRVRELSSIYDQVGSFRDFQAEEARAAARLAPLAFDRALDAGDRTDLLASLAEVDRINGHMVVQANQIIEAVRALHLKFPKAAVEEARRERVKDQRAVRGDCVLDLPLPADLR